jgi:DinB superfamily
MKTAAEAQLDRLGIPRNVEFSRTFGMVPTLVSGSRMIAGPRTPGPGRRTRRGNRRTAVRCDRGPVWVKLLVVRSDRTPRIDPAPEHLAWPGAALSWQAAHVTDFTRENLSGARFEDVNPDRAKMRPGDAAGYREAWDVLERLWQQTTARARRLDPELLHQRVNGEWSFTETLRHLVFGTDYLVNRAILGQPSPWDPLDLPGDEFPDEPGIPRDRDARPPLNQVLALRADRMATVRAVLTRLTDEQLASMTQPVTRPGHPEPESFPVARCLGAVLNEEWQHRLYAERDLDTLQRQPG